MTHRRFNDLVYMHYNLKLCIKWAQSSALSGPLSLEEIDPYSDWTAQEPSPLFSADEIIDLERQAMERGARTNFHFTMDDIEDEDDDDSNLEEALLVSHIGGDTSSSTTSSQSVGMSSEEAQPQTSQSRSSHPILVQGTSSRTRAPRFPASTVGKRTM